MHFIHYVKSFAMYFAYLLFIKVEIWFQKSVSENMLECGSVMNFCKLCYGHVKHRFNYDPVISRRQASLHIELARSKVGMHRDVSFHVYNILQEMCEKAKSVFLWNVRNHHFPASESYQPYNNHSTSAQKIGRTETGQGNSPFGKKGMKQFWESLILKFQ